jgi:DNA-binding CsgD family transcriptional regulator
MLAWTRELSGRLADARELALACSRRVDPGLVLAIDLANCLRETEDYEHAGELYERIVAHERGIGALGNLAYALENLALFEARLGSPTAGYANALEALQLTLPLGNDVALSAALARLALLEALLGRSADAKAHALRALEIARDRGDRWNETKARTALGADALAQGEAADAAAWLAEAADAVDQGGMRNRNRFRLDADLIEAQVRSGDVTGAMRHLEGLARHAAESGGAWATAVTARCEGLLADDADAVAAFEHALQAHDNDPSEFERTRTELLYGERLRRLGQRREARGHLRGAVESFDRLAVSPWADRARAELQATGERVKRRDSAAHEQLTPQQLQVSLAAAEGLTNKEIGARMFLSPKTIEFHLSGAYRKLEVRSRAELVRLFAEQGAPQIAAPG